MDPIGTALTLLDAQANARAQVIAAKIIKETAAADQAVAGLLEAAAANMDRVVSAAASGQGGLVDVTV